MESQNVSLVGYKLAPGRASGIRSQDDNTNCFWTIHLTQFALAEDPKPGRNIVKVVKSDGRQFVLGTLTRDNCEQFTTDFMISEPVKLVVSGESEVHVTGYLMTTELSDVALEDEDQLAAAERLLEGKEFSGDPNSEDTTSQDEVDDDEDPAVTESSDSDDQLPTTTVPNGKSRKAKKISLSKEDIKDLAKGLKSKRSKAEDIDFEGLEDSDLDPPQIDEGDTSDTTGGVSDETSDEDFSDTDTEEEEEETPPVVKAHDVAVKPISSLKDKKGEKAKRDRAVDEDSPQKPKAKKQKTEAAGTPEVGNDLAKSWEAAIVKYIAKEGASPLSKIGSSVKKPPGVDSKLKKLITASKSLALDSKDVVSLK